MTSYDDRTYTWQAGRQLAAIEGNGVEASYKYNDSGIRTQKIINDVVTNYTLVDGRVTRETKGTDTIYYRYDGNNDLVSMNLNGTEYFYLRNLQNDIISMVDDSGTIVVKYTYDTWGKLLTLKDGNDTDKINDTSFVGYKNPYRYRGYRYDVDTGLYYLQSRYYSPELCRFMSAEDTSILILTPVGCKFIF